MKTLKLVVALSGAWAMMMQLSAVAQTSGADATVDHVAPTPDVASFTLLMDITVSGAVGTPGVYRVPTTMKLVDVISRAGGPLPDAQLNNVRILHDLKVDPTITEPVMVLDLDDYSRTGDMRQNPILYPNDTIIIPLKTDAVPKPD